MKRVMVTIIYIMCASCVMEESDSFVVSGGLQEITTREELFARDLRLALTTQGTNFDSLAGTVRSCLTQSAIEQASPHLLGAADGFLAHKSEPNWLIYRQTSDTEEFGLSPTMISALAHQCEASRFQTAES